MTALAPQETAVVGHAATFQPLYELLPTMCPIRQHGLGRLVSSGGFGLGARFYITELEGECLAPAITDRFAIMDTEAVIRAGDAFSFDVQDWQEAFGHYPADVRGATKRFRGVNHRVQLLECECTNPPWVIHTGLTNVLWAHRICATAPTRWAAIKLLWRVRLNPAAFDRPLMAASVRLPY
jgi:hypothetical protein